MNQKRIVAGIVIGVLLPCMTLTVYANSSWHWFTRNPLPMLPWAIIGTLIIEISIIYRCNNIKGTIKPAIFIIAGNLFSFLIPYIFIGTTPEKFEENANFFIRIERTADKLPFYSVGVAFLILTLLIEIPFVYTNLKRVADNRKKLLLGIAAANSITTVAAAAAERFIYRGSW